MRLNLQQIKERQEEFDRNHQGSIPFFEDIKEGNIEALEHLIVCLVGEVGEFANILKKIRRGDFTYLDKRGELEEELVDIFIYIIKMSNQMHSDLEKNYLEKLERNEVKFQKYKV